MTKPRTLTEHAEHHAGKDKKLTPQKPRCTGARTIDGRTRTCGKPIHHAGDHKVGAFTWRRSSGDTD